jgi:hypothetical protein
MTKMKLEQKVERISKAFDTALFAVLVVIPLFTLLSVVLFFAGLTSTECGLDHMVPFGSYMAFMSLRESLVNDDLRFSLLIGFVLSILLYYQCAIAIRKKKTAVPVVMLLFLVFDRRYLRESIATINYCVTHQTGNISASAAQLLPGRNVAVGFVTVVMVMIGIYLINHMLDVFRSEKTRPDQ